MGFLFFLFWLDACFKTDGPLFSPSSCFTVLGEGGWGIREGDGDGDLTVYGGCGGGDGGGDRDDGGGDGDGCGDGDAAACG